MLEKLLVAVTLTFALNLFLEHSWSNNTQTTTNVQLQNTVDQTMEQLAFQHTPSGKRRGI